MRHEYPRLRRQIIRLRTAVVTAVVVTAAATAAAAQTAGPAPAPDDFYVRAGMALDWSADTRFTDADCSSTSAAVLYGCGTALDGTPLSSLGNFGALAGYNLGVGYVAAPALRLEAVVQHHPHAAFDGRANFVQTTGRQAVSADLSVLSGMLAAYLDLAELGLPRLGPFSLFVGGGAGLSRIALDVTRMEFPKTTTIVPAGQRVNFTWMPVAGLSTSLGNQTTLDVAWRYTDAGAVATGRGLGRIVWRDGSRDPLEITLAETTADLSSHGLWLSLRYSF